MSDLRYAERVWRRVLRQTIKLEDVIANTCIYPKILEGDIPLAYYDYWGISMCVGCEMRDICGDDPDLMSTLLRLRKHAYNAVQYASNRRLRYSRTGHDQRRKHWWEIWLY